MTAPGTAAACAASPTSGATGPHTSTCPVGTGTGMGPGTRRDGTQPPCPGGDPRPALL